MDCSPASSCTSSQFAFQPRTYRSYGSSWVLVRQCTKLGHSCFLKQPFQGNFTETEASCKNIDQNNPPLNPDPSERSPEYKARQLTNQLKCSVKCYWKSGNIFRHKTCWWPNTFLRLYRTQSKSEINPSIHLLVALPLISVPHANQLTLQFQTADPGLSVAHTTSRAYNKSFTIMSTCSHYPLLNIAHKDKRNNTRAVWPATTRKCAIPCTSAQSPPQPSSAFWCSLSCPSFCLTFLHTSCSHTGLGLLCGHLSFTFRPNIFVHS
jgi:hypothetical protein